MLRDKQAIEFRHKVTNFHYQKENNYLDWRRCRSFCHSIRSTHTFTWQNPVESKTFLLFSTSMLYCERIDTKSHCSWCHVLQWKKDALTFPHSLQRRLNFCLVRPAVDTVLFLGSCRDIPCGNNCEKERNKLQMLRFPLILLLICSLEANFFLSYSVLTCFWHTQRRQFFPSGFKFPIFFNILRNRHGFLHICCYYLRVTRSFILWVLWRDLSFIEKIWCDSMDYAKNMPVSSQWQIQDFLRHPRTPRKNSCDKVFPKPCGDEPVNKKKKTFLQN